MENTSKTAGMADALKNFYRLRKEIRTQEQDPEVAIDIEIEEDEDDTPADILKQDRTDDGEMEDEEEEDDESPEDAWDDCPCGGGCGSEYGTMVLVARPRGDNSVMTMDELAEEIGDIFAGQTGTYDMHPVPGTEDLYYTIPEKKPLKRGGKTFYKAPAVVFGIDEDEGEIVSPGAKQLYAAARYFENAARTIKTREGGETAVFCFD